MTRFVVTITETLKRKVSVDAHSADEAKRIASSHYYNEDIVLDSSDFSEVEFEAKERNPRKKVSDLVC